MNIIQQSYFVTDWLEKRARLTPERVAVVDAESGNRTIFSDWNIRVNRTANFLSSLGVAAGDRVSVYASNCVEYLDILFACGKIGAIQHNLNWRLTVHELRGIIADAEPAVLIYSRDWRANVDNLRLAFAQDTKVVAVDPEAGSADIPFTERANHAPVLQSHVELAMDDPWGIYYTGGTTGLPKGAIMTHGNMTWNSINTIMSWGITAEDSALLQLPLFHIGGPNIFMLPLVHVGGKTILCKKFDLEQTFDLIENGGVTHFVGVPTMYVMMQQHPRWQTADFSGLKLVISGGAPCPLPVMRMFWDRGIDFKMGYGLTEASGNNFWLPQNQVRQKISSVGYPIFHVDVRIVDEAGQLCPPDHEGELQIRGPHVTPGYWRKPEETAAILKNGWLLTGDVAKQDKDGCFYIIGRSKDMFISGGENVYPAEVESAMHAHPAVAEAALVGVPDERWGEVGKAFVVVDAGASLSQEQLLQFLAQGLAKYKIPRAVVFLSELPKTAIGKLDKKALRELVNQEPLSK